MPSNCCSMHECNEPAESLRCLCDSCVNASSSFCRLCWCPFTNIFDTQDLLCHCGLALLLQFAVSAVVVFKATQLDPSASRFIHVVADVLIAAFPSGIPAVISFGILRCTVALKKKDIEVHHIPGYQLAVHAQVCICQILSRVLAVLHVARETQA